MVTQKNAIKGFTKQYGVHHLVYYELHESMIAAIQREKQMKKWNRAWKLELKETQNPDWKDLWKGIVRRNEDCIPAFAGMNGHLQQSKI